MKERLFKGYLMLNWKTGNVRIIKSKGHDLNPYEIRVPYNIKITLPEVKDTPLNIDIVLPVVDTSDIKM